MATKKSAGYQIDFTTKTLTITKEFSDNAQDPASKEFGILMNLQKAIHGLTVIRKTHATPRKYVSKSTGETFNCHQFKNLTFDNMEHFIDALPNHDELLKSFKFLKYYGGLPQTSRYPVVRRWFVAQFPEFRKNPLFYLYNEVKVIDITPLIQQAKEEAAEKAAEKAMKEAVNQD